MEKWLSSRYTQSCVPALSTNLISATTLQREHTIEMPRGNNGAIISIKGDKNSQIQLHEEHGLPVLYIDKSLDTALNANAPLDLETWHKRLGHVNQKTIQNMVDKVTGLHIHSANSHNCENCEICVATKMHKTPFKPSTRRTTRPLELVHTDVAGPMRVPSAVHGHTYAILFKDDFSRHVRVYTMKHKSEALEKFKQYIADVGSPQAISTAVALDDDDNGKAIPNS